MSYYKTDIMSLIYVYDLFNLLAVNQDSLVAGLESNIDDNEIMWECVDDRFNSFYGATFEVPLSKYKIHNYADRYTGKKVEFIGDRWLYSDKIVYEYQSVKYTCDYKNTVFDALFECSLDVPNYDGETYKHSDFYSWASADSEYKATLISLLENYMSNADEENLPSYIVFNGVEGELELGTTAEEIIFEINKFFNWCDKNKIKPLLIFTYNKSVASNRLNDYLKITSKIDKLKSFSFYDWLYDHTENKIGINKYIIENLDITERYTKFVYDLFKRKIISLLFTDAYRDSFFVSMMYRAITDGSYGEYLSNAINRKKAKLNADGAETTMYNKLGNSTTFSGINAFKANGEFIAIGVHTLYTENAWFNEQPQINCNSEFVNILNKNIANLLDIEYYPPNTPHLSKYCDYALYPGTGCPWLTVSGKNKEDYKSPLTNTYKLTVYLTKTDFSGTISIRMSNEYNDNVPHSAWQSVEFGKLSDNEINDIFPLYVGGGTTGLSDDVWYIIQQVNLLGNLYDLDITNVCMSNSTILHPTKFNGADISNVRILGSDGIWENVYNHQQTASTQSYPSMAKFPPDMASVLNNITDAYDSNACVLPIANVYGHSIQYTDSLSEVKKEHKMFLYPIEFALNKTNNKNLMSVGQVVDCYAMFGVDLVDGEIEYDNHLYLSIPCGWKERLWNYNFHKLGIVNDEWEFEQIVKDYEMLNQPLANKTINTRLLIRLR